MLEEDSSLRYRPGGRVHSTTGGDDILDSFYGYPPLRLCPRFHPEFFSGSLKFNIFLPTWKDSEKSK